MDRGRVLDSRIGNFLTSETEIELAAESSCCARATPEKTPHPLRVLTSRMMTHVPEGPVPRPLACVPRPLGTAVLAMEATPAREAGAVAGLGEPRRRRLPPPRMF